jgi:hypothetical protein
VRGREQHPHITSHDSRADIGARSTRSWDDAAAAVPEIEQAPLPCPLRSLENPRQQGRMHDAPAAPPECPAPVRCNYQARVISSLIGVCPFCREVASVNADASKSRTQSGSWVR